MKIYRVISFGVLVSLMSRQAVAFQRYRHPVPFYPGLREPHGQNFRSGPHNQRRVSFDNREKRPNFQTNLFVFPDHRIPPKDLFALSSEHSEEHLRPNQILFDSGRRPPSRFSHNTEGRPHDREPNNRGPPPRHPEFALRYPNRGQNVRRRPRPNFNRNRFSNHKRHRNGLKRHPSDRQPPIIIYEGSRPPVVSYYRPAGSGFNDQSKFKRFPPNNIQRGSTANKRPNTEERIRLPFIDEVTNDIEDPPVYAEGQSHGRLPVFAHTITENPISDNAAGWIPIPSNHESHFTGEYGLDVQEYKEPAILDKDHLAPYFSSNFEDNESKNKLTVFGPHHGISNVDNERFDQTTEFYGDPTGHGEQPGPALYEESVDDLNQFNRHSVLTSKDSQSANGLYPDNNGYEDPTGHGEQVFDPKFISSEHFTDGASKTDQSNYQYDTHNALDERHTYPEYKFEDQASAYKVGAQPQDNLVNYKVSVSSSYGSDQRDQKPSNNDYSSTYSYFTDYSEPLVTDAYIPSASAKNTRTTYQPRIPYSQHNTGFSKVIPEDRDMSNGADEALTVLS